MFGGIWSVCGTVVVLATLADALWTTLTVSGAGWGSSVLAGIVGRTAMKGPRPIAENASIVALCASFLFWLLLLWAGWTMVFFGAEGAVLNATTSAPADMISRIYYSGFTLTTLGVGDFKPGHGIWQLATVLAAASGFVVLTLFVSYAVSVISAINDRRTLGAAVYHLGATPASLILLLNDGGKQALSTRLLTLTDQLEQAAMQSDAFPVLEYSHVSNPCRSFALSVVTLGEATLLWEYALSDQHQLPAAVWKPLQRAVNLMISDKHGAFDLKHAKEPPPPDWDRLRHSGLTFRTGVAEAFQQDAVREMRRHWAAWLQWHGREWSILRDASAAES